MGTWTTRLATTTAVLTAGALLGPATAVAAPPSATDAVKPAPTSASTRAPQIHSVDWDTVTVPGAVCDAAQPIRLSAGRATIATPPHVEAGTPQVIVARRGEVVYGNLDHAGQDEAALNVWCTNTGGMAAGQIKNSWVIYSADSGALRVLGTLVPRQPAGAKRSHVPYFEAGPGAIDIRPGKIIVRELWYAPSDATCCPSIRASTVWTYADGILRPASTTRS